MNRRADRAEKPGQHHLAVGQHVAGLAERLGRHLDQEVARLLAALLVGDVAAQPCVFVPGRKIVEPEGKADTAFACVTG
ncbi:MAG: hypothetical protein JSU82_07320 [Rhodospirillales bacterium]|nr:MAG: hypothetical protein JSU82_07320 [Rhodospirillales bacterium]